MRTLGVSLSLVIAAGLCLNALDHKAPGDPPAEPAATAQPLASPQNQNQPPATNLTHLVRTGEATKKTLPKAR